MVETKQPQELFYENGTRSRCIWLEGESHYLVGIVDTFYMDNVDRAVRGIGQAAKRVLLDQANGEIAATLVRIVEAANSIVYQSREARSNQGASILLCSIPKELSKDPTVQWVSVGTCKAWYMRGDEVTELVIDSNRSPGYLGRNPTDFPTLDSGNLKFSSHARIVLSTGILQQQDIVENATKTHTRLANNLHHRSNGGAVAVWGKRGENTSVFTMLQTAGVLFALVALTISMFILFPGIFDSIKVAMSPATSTPTLTPTATATSTNTLEDTPTPTKTDEPTSTHTATVKVASTETRLPTPTVTPTPKNTPTFTPRPTWTPAPSTSTPTPTTAPLYAPITIESIDEKNFGNNVWEFTWTASRALEDDEYFEVVFWEGRPDIEDAEAFGIAEAKKDTSLTIDLNLADRNTSLEPGDFQWGVRLVPLGVIIGNGNEKIRFRRISEATDTQLTEGPDRKKDVTPEPKKQ